MIKNQQKKTSPQKLRELRNLEREKVNKYKQALQKSQQLLVEEREKNGQPKPQTQKCRDFH